MQNNNKLLTLYYHQENTHRSHIKEHVKNLPEQKQKIFQKAIINFLQRPVLTRTDINLWDNRIKTKITIKDISTDSQEIKDNKTSKEARDQEIKNQEIEDQIIDQSSCSAFMGLNLFGCF